MAKSPLITAIRCSLMHCVRVLLYVLCLRAIGAGKWLAIPMVFLVGGLGL